MTIKLDDFTDDELSVRDLARRLATEKVAPRAQAIDVTGQYPQDVFDMLKDLGLFAIPFPAEYGGLGSMTASCLAIEELGRVCYNTAYMLVVQWDQFAIILSSGSEEQKSRYLPGLASGAIRGAFSLTEPQSGSDVAGIKTRAVRESNGYRLNGSKVWCTNAAVADFVLVAARTGSPEERGALSLFIVEPGTPGFQIGPSEHKMGGRGVPSSPLYLDNVFIPESNRIGEEGKGFIIAMEELNRARPIAAARALGLAQGAMDHAIDFIKNRRAFNRQISDFQGIRWMIADMATQIAASRNLIYQTARAVDNGLRGHELRHLAALAKLHATDTAMKVATDAVQLFGAAGISNDYPINRYFRDAKVLQIVEGTSQIQKNIIARTLLGKESTPS
ncbi:acyl-CoA dehydrogenase family protein (plasmid) [Mesorhizobium sp. ORM8.1]